MKTIKIKVVQTRQKKTGNHLLLKGKRGTRGYHRKKMVWRLEVYRNLYNKNSSGKVSNKSEDKHKNKRKTQTNRK